MPRLKPLRVTERRFSCPHFSPKEEDNVEDEVLLSDEPPARAPAAPPPAAPAAASDPLSLAAESGAGYRDTYASLASQPVHREAPRDQQGAAGPTPLASAGPATANPTAQPRPQPRSYALDDSEEIGPASSDAGFLRATSSAAARSRVAGNGAASTSGPGAGSSRGAPQYHITVSDPVRRIGDSVIPGFTSTHTEYLVASTAVGEGAGGRERRRIEVRRRFKDFVVSRWCVCGGCVVGGCVF